MNGNYQPRLIKGRNIQLESMAQEHFEPLCECLLNEPNGWFSRMFNYNTAEAIQKTIHGSVKAGQERRGFAFVVRDLKSGRVAGFSNFMKIDERNRQLEIGFTQIGKAFRKTHVNTEKKFLMLRTAFEELKTVRVYFKADAENADSQNAILRIGATYEGTLRKDCILPDGRIRDYRVYSVIDSEWPVVSARLLNMMESYR